MGYLGGVLAGDSMAHLRRLRLAGAFRVLAVVAAASSVAAVLYLVNQRRTV
jgi:hypothetical protein